MCRFFENLWFASDVEAQRKNVCSSTIWALSLECATKSGIAYMFASYRIYLYSIFFENLLFPDMPCMKRVYRDKLASVHWSAARNEERSRSRS